MPLSVDVVIPVYNEEAAVEVLVARLRAACPGATLIFVDNGSTDRTLPILERLDGIRLVRHDRNLGYGRSILDGIQAGVGEAIVIIDADLEYYPEDIPRLLAELERSPAVLGSRLLGRPDGPEPMPRLRSLGNRLVSSWFNLLFHQHVTDLYTGLRAIRRLALPACALITPGFEFVVELSTRLAQAGIQLAEVPVGYAPRTTGRSKMRHLREFLKFCYYLVYFRLTPGAIVHGAGSRRSAAGEQDRTA